MRSPSCVLAWIGLSWSSGCLPQRQGGLGDGQDQGQDDGVWVDSSATTGGTTTDASAGTGTEGSTTTDGTTSDASTSDAASTGMDEGSDPTGGDDEGGPKFDIGALPDGPCASAEPEYDFSDIWIANTDVGTVTKIDTATGIVSSRFRTSDHTHDPIMLGGDSPSRTSVNQFGDAVVANRGPRGGVTAFASLPHRCRDRDGDQRIRTSMGMADVLPWTQDECWLWHYPIADTDFNHGPRSLAWEGGVYDAVTCTWSVPNPRVWLAYRGASGTYEVRRLNGQTGEELDALSITGIGGIPYGGAVDRSGNFWMGVRARAYSSGGMPAIVRIDGITLEYDLYPIPDVQNLYGMGMDEQGQPWFAVWHQGAGDHVLRFDLASESFVDAGGVAGTYRGLQIDGEGKVWVAGNNPCRLSLFDASTSALVKDDIPLAGCLVPVGISIDHEGYVWVVDRDASRVYKIDPNPPYREILRIDGMFHPYTYSDMTGFGLNLVHLPPG